MRRCVFSEMAKGGGRCGGLSVGRNGHGAAHMDFERQEGRGVSVIEEDLGHSAVAQAIMQPCLNRQAEPILITAALQVTADGAPERERRRILGAIPVIVHARSPAEPVATRRAMRRIRDAQPTSPSLRFQLEKEPARLRPGAEQ